MTLFRTSTAMAALTLGLLLIGASSPADAKCRYAPATSVCMEIPSGFEVSKAFPGFENPIQATEVHVSELDRPYREVVADMTLDKFQKRGMKVLFARKEVIGEAPAMRVKIQDDSGEGTLFRQVLIVGYPQKTILVSAVYPEAMETTSLTDRLEVMMHSLQYDAEREPELTRNLPFELDDQEGLVLARRVRNNVIYTKDGKLPKPLATDPTFIAGEATFAEPVDDRLDFAIERIKQLPGMNGILVDKVQEINLDGLDGYEITAQSRDRESNARLALYQVLLYEGDNTYYLLVGTVGQDDKQAFLEKFRAMARSFRRR